MKQEGRRASTRSYQNGADYTTPGRGNYPYMPWMSLEPELHSVTEEVAKGLKSLTVCEKSCLYWVSLGKTSAETALLLGRSEHTVNFHLATACRKLAVGSRHAVVRYMLQAGLLRG